MKMKFSAALKKLFFRAQSAAAFTPSLSEQKAAIRIVMLEETLKGMVKMARVEAALGSEGWKRAADVADAIVNETSVPLPDSAIMSGAMPPEPKIPMGWQSL